MAVNYEYLAGILDGEGCFAVYERSGYYTLHLQITARDRWFLEEIQSRHGGKINTTGKSKLSGNQMWYLRFRKPEIMTILPEVIPHLILKKEQAKMLLQAAHTTEGHRHRQHDRGLLAKIVGDIKAMKGVQYGS